MDTPIVDLEAPQYEDVGIVLPKAKKGDVLMLYVPAWVHTCVSHHGIEHIVGFYEGQTEDDILLRQSPEIATRVYFEDVDGAKIMTPDTAVRDVGEFNEIDMDNIRLYDCLLMHDGKGPRAVGFFVNHGTPPGEEERIVRLEFGRKAAYTDQGANHPLRQFTGFQVLDKFTLHPRHDGIDNLLYDMFGLGFDMDDEEFDEEASETDE